MPKLSKDVTFRQLDIFVSVARLGSFATAAHHLGISQPAVSDHIAALEQRLGYRLFERRRGTTPLLTPAGQELLADAQAVLSSSQAIRREGSEASVSGSVRVRLALSIRNRQAFLRPLLTRLYRELPQVEIDLVLFGPLPAMVAALDAGKLDLMLATVAVLIPRPAHLTQLGTIPIALVTSPAMAGKMTDGTLAIEDAPFVIPDLGAISDRGFQHLFASVGLVPRSRPRTIEFDDISQNLAEEGLAIALLKSSQVAPAIAQGRLATVGPSLPPLQRIIARSPRAGRIVETLRGLLMREAAFDPDPPAQYKRNEEAT